ncbi:hypothetical protein ACH4UR_25565 [Streptomyces lydicus]|uniref:hypothetical protein n=1 Tax=Streptomyces lydicus TaxID=47763 RepID=UPI0033E9B79F
MAQALLSYADANAERIGGGRVPTTNLDPVTPGPALTTEYFAPVLAALELPGEIGQFIDEAVRPANEDFTGTLGVNLVAYPRTIAGLGRALDEVNAELHYGRVALNAWAGIGYPTENAIWGAFPGHTPKDMQSGIGAVQNALLPDGPKTPP